MTENEVAKKNLETLERFYRIAKSGSALHEVLSVYVTLEDLVEAIQALEEIQQYKAIGLTPSMVEDLIKSCKKHEKNALENAHIVDDYREIGTVEEFKALKEKNEPKKPLHNGANWYRCPNGCEVRKKAFEKDWYCPKCGQAIDWQ